MRFMEEVFRQYAAVMPEDRKDLEFFMSTETWREMSPAVGPDEPGWLPLAGTHLLGAPVRIDDNMPFGTIETRTETQLDRAVRRANAAGHALNVMKTEAWIPPPMPAPTLKALVRHWMRKLKRILR